MDMIRHHDEFMKKIGGSAIVIKGLDEKFRPAFPLKKSPSSPCGGRDPVRVARVRGVFPGRSHNDTSAAKAANLVTSYGAP